MGQPQGIAPTKYNWTGRGNPLWLPFPAKYRKRSNEVKFVVQYLPDRNYV